MREILFRGKRVDGGEWCYGVPLVEGWSKKTYIASYEYSSLTFIQQIEIIPETVGQFTGLTDKNGKRIFEGDIVKQKINRDEYKWRVFFGEHQIGCCGYCYDAHQSVGFYLSETEEGFTFADYDEWENLEVIGNIHDNPELLTD